MKKFTLRKLLLNFHLLFLLVNKIQLSNILSIHLEDKKVLPYTPNRLFLNLTQNYQVYLATDTVFPNFSLFPFLIQSPSFLLPKYDKKLPGGETGPSLFFNLPLNIFGLSEPINIAFYSLENTGTFCVSGEYITLYKDYGTLYTNASIIHQLHQKNIIQSTQFGFDLNIYDKNEFLFLGGLPNHIKTLLGKEHIIKIESNYGSWVTTHHSILVDGKEYGANNLFVSIDLSHKHIILDTNTFSKITSLLLDKYLFEKKCGNVTYTVTNIFCDEDVVKNLNIPKIYLVSKEDSIEFKKENIFYCIEDHKCEYMLRGDYSNSWKIGYAFLKGYISLFDREGGRVIVYEKKEINILDIQNVFSVSLKLLVYFEIGIITFGLVIIVLSMLDNNDNYL